MKSEEQSLKKEKIASLIQDEILTGRFLAGEYLLPERELADRSQQCVRATDAL